MNKVVQLLGYWGLCFSLIFFFACKTQQDTVNTLENINSPLEATLDTIHTSKNSLDWVGTYTGVLNSMQNQLVEYALTLKANSSFELHTNFPNNPKPITPIKGNFSWNEDENQIVLESIGFNIRVLEDVIEITDQFKEQHLNLEDKTAFLYKVQEEFLLNRFWILNNTSFTDKSLEKLNKKAFLLFQFNERAVFYGGCNNCQIGFKIEIPKKLKFDKNGICTKMFCPEETHLDDELLSILKNTASYDLFQDSLILKDANNKILAKLNSLLIY